jgi:hypothetical protein
VERNQTALQKIIEKWIIKTKQGIKALAKFVLSEDMLGEHIRDAKDIIWSVKQVAGRSSTKYDRVSAIIETFANSLLTVNRSYDIINFIWLSKVVLWPAFGKQFSDILGFAIDHWIALSKQYAEQIKFYGKNIQIFKEWNSAREATKTTLQKADQAHRWLLLDEIYIEKISRLYLGINQDLWVKSKWEEIKKLIINDPSSSNMNALQDLIQSLDPHKVFVQKIIPRVSNTTGTPK